MLFEIIPESFFSPLASPSRLVYWDCICKLFAVTRGQLSFGVERSVLMDELEFYFSSTMAADLKEAEEAGVGQDPRDKAGFILRRLEACGWLSTETDYSFVQRTSFRDYAITLIRTLIGISEKKKQEYQGYIYTIYSLVRIPLEENPQPGTALLQIHKNTDDLIAGLKSLSSNIKSYIDDLTRHSTVAEILDALLNDYYTNIVDKAYHRLLTSDNVSKFRPEIVSRLEGFNKNPIYIEEAAKEIARIEEITPVQASERVKSLLIDVIDAFRQMDDILNDINQKNARYQRAAIGRAKFLLLAKEDIQGQLRDILLYLGEEAERRQEDFNAIYELEEIEGLVRLFSWEYLDTDSLYEPIEKKKAFVPAPMPKRKPDAAEREKRRKALFEKIDQQVSPEKIDAYIRSYLGDKESIKASDLPLEGEGFVNLIYARIYGQRKEMSYTIEKGETVTVGSYQFPNFTIWSKKGRGEGRKAAGSGKGRAMKAAAPEAGQGGTAEAPRKGGRRKSSREEDQLSLLSLFDAEDTAPSSGKTTNKEGGHHGPI